MIPSNTPPCSCSLSSAYGRFKACPCFVAMLMLDAFPVSTASLSSLYPRPHLHPRPPGCGVTFFLCYVFATYQVLIQFPDAFEFNQLFLLEILDHVTNGRSGTFLLSFDTTRDETKLRQNSLSVWTILNQNLERYCNPWYNPELRFNCEPLMPNYHVGKLQLWEAYYCRCD